MRKKSRLLTILNNPLFLIFLLLAYHKPGCFELIAPAVDRAFDMWRIIAVLVVLVIYIMRGKLSKIVLIVMLYNIIVFFSTAINDADYWKVITRFGTVTSYCMLAEMCITKYGKRYFTCLFNIYFILIAINFVVLLLFPKGIAVDDYYINNTYGFLGIDNAFVNYTVPSLAIACIYSAYRGKRFTVRAFAMLIMVSATVLITWSATGVVVWFVEMVYILFVYKSHLAKYFHSVSMFLIYAIMQIGIVGMRLQNRFAYIIENVLGKTISLTGRTTLWDLSFLLIAHSPIIGYGLTENKGLLRLHNRYWYAHNGFLEVMLEVGIIGTLVYISLFIFAAIPLYRHRKHSISGIITIAIFSFLIFSLTEAIIDSPWLFGMLVIAVYVHDIINQVDDEQLKRNGAGKNV